MPYFYTTKHILLMKNTITTPRFIFITTTIIVTAISRVIPHFDNVTPVAAMALFGGACLSDKRLAIIVPLLAMFISDIFIGFHNTLVYVYVGMIITSLIGIGMRNNIKTGNIFVGSVASSVIFYLITNFGYWATSMHFANGTTGLFQSYVDAIPFFRNSLLGDLCYNTVLFGVMGLASKRIPALVKA